MRDCRLLFLFCSFPCLGTISYPLELIAGQVGFGSLANNLSIWKRHASQLLKCPSLPWTQCSLQFTVSCGNGKEKSFNLTNRKNIVKLTPKRNKREHHNQKIANENEHDRGALQSVHCFAIIACCNQVNRFQTYVPFHNPDSRHTWLHSYCQDPPNINHIDPPNQQRVCCSNGWITFQRAWHISILKSCAWTHVAAFSDFGVKIRTMIICSCGFCPKFLSIGYPRPCPSSSICPTDVSIWRPS